MKNDKSKDMPSPMEMEDIVKNPKKYGAPTYEEFCANPDKYRPIMNARQQLDLIDNGGQNLKRYTKTKVFEVLGQTFNSLERAENFCKEHGLPMGNWKVVASNMGGQFAEERVIFGAESKEDKKS